MHKVHLSFVVIGLTLFAGCAIPQPRGMGQYARVQEPSTLAWYHLYLPVDYVKNKGRRLDRFEQKWPLVVTFHGMKPYDNAHPQEREWEEQADIYGYVVCAPELRTCDSFVEFPLTKEHDYVLEDKRNVLAIMDHVFATTAADPEKVLSTSWSCGGYLAHYFVNRFPDRFACIATRLSNFSAKLLVEDNVPLYRDRVPVAIYIGDGDFSACKRESQEAAAWYKARDFRVVRAMMIDNMGHRRIPQMAAAFFAGQIGIQPLHPVNAAKTVSTELMTDYNPPSELIARLSPFERRTSRFTQGQSRNVRTLSSR
jgi:poly(3-hydroxybutyrate) depolymerase